MSLTVLMLINELNVGGTETHLLALAKQLTQNDVKVIIGTNGGPLAPVFRENKLTVVDLPFASDDPVFEEYQALLRKTKELVSEYKVDVIHAHSLAGMKVAVQIGQELLIPTIATIHGMFYPRRQLRNVLERCTRVIAVSLPVAIWLNRRVDYPENRIITIPNGIETDFFVPADAKSIVRTELKLQKNDRLAVLVSRLAWEKTRVAETAIQAAVSLQKEFPLHLAIIGGGVHTPLIRAAAHLANIRAKKKVVHVLGVQLNTRDYYQEADLVIGTARVALEALSCEKPVIAAGNTSYFGPIDTGNADAAWSAYFGDHEWVQPLTIPRLTADMKQILSSKEATADASTLREWVKSHFSVVDMALQTKKAYQAVASGTPPPVVTRKYKEDKFFIQSIARQKAEESPPVKLADLKRKPLVSVAIPVFNREKFLPECLDSIAAQTYRPLEIVVVNDGSTDETEKAALNWWEKLKNKRELSFVYLKLPKNTGNVGAQSVAYHLSTGDYIANQDSDDISHKDRIKEQVQFLLANPDYSLVGTNFVSFKDDISQTTKSHMVEYGFKNILNAYRGGGHCVCFGTLLSKREVFERIGGLTSHLLGAQDYEWIARALENGFYVDNLRTSLYYYRTHPGQTSRQFYSSAKRSFMMTEVSGDE